MRPFVAGLVFCLPCLAWAEPGLDLTTSPDSYGGAGDFRLGGAATRPAVVPTQPTEEPAPSAETRLSLPLGAVPDAMTRSEKVLGPATVFVSEGMEDGRDALELGTFLRRGQARAGLSVTYLETQAQLKRSELFVDYALSDRFSVGLSGILDAELGDTEPVRQLGLNAEYSTSGGAFLQGGVAGAADFDPVIGLSIGLRF